MVTRADLLVIGGGMAGSMAAISAAAEGQNTIVVRHGMGATALSSGAIDLEGTLAWLERILDSKASAAKALDGALTMFQEMAAAAGYAHSGGIAENMALANPFGTIKRTQLAPRTIASGDLRKVHGARVLFVGVRGYGDYCAPRIAESVRSLAEAGGTPLAEASSVEVEFPPLRHTSNVTSFDLAQLLDSQETAVEFGRQLADQAGAMCYTHVALPPIAGRSNPERVVQTIQEVLGRPCFETLGLPPSVPGYRLQQALDRAMAQKGVRLVHATVDGFAAHQGRVVHIRATQKQKTHEFAPAAVVLASGKFISGGLQRSDRVRETVFDLPIFVDGRPESGSAMAHLVTDRFTARQPIFGAGVRVDDQFRPITTDGQGIYENLFAAGSICMGNDYARGDGGLGASLASGYLCGKNATRCKRSLP